MREIRKCKILFPALMLVIGFLNSCTEEVNQDIFVEQQTMSSVQTRSGEFDESNHISYSDIVRMTGLNSQDGKRKSKSSAIINCITDSQSDTLLYAVDKANGGWEIYSSDKRVPHVVAYSNTGSISELMSIEGARLWLQSMANDMKIVKNLDDSQLKFSQKEIADNKSFWKSIIDPDLYVIDTSNGSQLHKFDTIGNIIKPHPLPRGHYEYIGSTSFWEDYDSISRLTLTNWHQDHPFNKYCPHKAKSYGRAPAGCVAIAAAQMLFFLHREFGVPRTAPSKAYCNGFVGSNYDWAQTDYTSEVWDEMVDNPEAAAPLIADIGRRVGMDYGDESSTAYNKDLINNVFKPYGISATYTSYDENILVSNLKNGIPVILGASTYIVENGKNVLVGHTFIADRYKRTRERVKSIYRWVYDFVPPNTLIECVEDSITMTYRNPEITMIGMNWGWNPKYVSNEKGWFALTGDWCVNTGSENLNWNVGRDMIYINGINL